MSRTSRVRAATVGGGVLREAGCSLTDDAVDWPKLTAYVVFALFRGLAAICAARGVDLKVMGSLRVHLSNRSSDSSLRDGDPSSIEDSELSQREDVLAFSMAAAPCDASDGAARNIKVKERKDGDNQYEA